MAREGRRRRAHAREDRRGGRRPLRRDRVVRQGGRADRAADSRSSFWRSASRRRSARSAQAALRDCPPSPDGGVIADYLGTCRRSRRARRPPRRHPRRGRARPLPAEPRDRRDRRGAKADGVKLIDVTIPIRNGMPVYDRNPGVRLERARSIADGDAVNISRLDLGVHTGTHVDAPVHFIEGGERHRVDRPRDPDRRGARGRCDEPARGHRRAKRSPRSTCPTGRRAPDLQDAQLGALEPRRVHARLHPLPRERRGVRCVEARRAPGRHRLPLDRRRGRAPGVPLANGVVPLEGLDLRKVEPGRYRLYCLPLKLVGSDGAPARVLLEPL